MSEKSKSDFSRQKIRGEFYGESRLKGEIKTAYDRILKKYEGKSPEQLIPIIDKVLGRVVDQNNPWPEIVTPEGEHGDSFLSRRTGKNFKYNYRRNNGVGYIKDFDLNKKGLVNASTRQALCLIQAENYEILGRKYFEEIKTKNEQYEKMKHGSFKGTIEQWINGEGKYDWPNSAGESIKKEVAKAMEKSYTAFRRASILYAGAHAPLKSTISAERAKTSARLGYNTVGDPKEMIRIVEDADIESYKPGLFGGRSDYLPREPSSSARDLAFKLMEESRSVTGRHDKFPLLSVAFLSFIGSLFFLQSNFTGNAISNLTQSSSNFIGAGLFCVSIVCGIFALKKDEPYS